MYIFAVMKVIKMAQICSGVYRGVGGNYRTVVSVLWGYMWFIHQVIRAGSFVRIGFGSIGWWSLNRFGLLIIRKYNIKMVDDERLIKWDKDLRVPTNKK